MEPGVEVTFERRDERGGGVVRGLAVVHEYDVAAVGESCLAGAIPEVATGGVGALVTAFPRGRGFARCIVATAQRPHFFYAVGGIGAPRPIAIVWPCPAFPC